jgi:hypothetical protein
LTYDGASVAGKNHSEVVINNVDLGGGGTVGDESVTTEGQTNRMSLAILRALGVIAGSPPVQGESSTVTAGTINPTNSAWPGEELIRALAAEAGIEDRLPGIETAVLAAVGLS